MYDQFAFSVTTCEHATIALSLLRDRRGRYDIVLTDVHMPDMDGFKLLEIVGLEMDLPVVSEYLTQTQLPLISFMFISIYRLFQVIEFQGILRLHISFKWTKNEESKVEVQKKKSHKITSRSMETESRDGVDLIPSYHPSNSSHKKIKVLSILLS